MFLHLILLPHPEKRYLGADDIPELAYLSSLVQVPDREFPDVADETNPKLTPNLPHSPAHHQTQFHLLGRPMFLHLASLYLIGWVVLV